MSNLEPNYRNLEAGLLGSVLLDGDTFHRLRPMQLSASDFYDGAMAR